MDTRFSEFARRAAAACCARVVVVLALAVIHTQAQAVRAGNARQSPLDESRQVLVVVTDGWESVGGTLRRFERDNRSVPWRQVGSPVPVVVGKNGLGWGRGLPIEPGDGPIKKEGDGKGPAGVFRLAGVFGQSPEPPARLAMPYQFLGQNVECVDDVRSAHYNRLVTRQQVDRADWTSSEKMWTEPLYKWGVVVEHNSGPPQPSGGSCIFLHIWRGPTAGTAGCTAMAESALLDTITWLDAGKTPVLVQLPRVEYERVKAAWRLP